MTTFSSRSSNHLNPQNADSSLLPRHRPYIHPQENREGQSSSSPAQIRLQALMLCSKVQLQLLFKDQNSLSIALERNLQGLYEQAFAEQASHPEQRLFEIIQAKIQGTQNTALQQVWNSLQRKWAPSLQALLSATNDRDIYQSLRNFIQQEMGRNRHSISGEYVAWVDRLRLLAEGNFSENVHRLLYEENPAEALGQQLCEELLRLIRSQGGEQAFAQVMEGAQGLRHLVANQEIYDSARRMLLAGNLQENIGVVINQAAGFTSSYLGAAWAQRGVNTKNLFIASVLGGVTGAIQGGAQIFIRWQGLTREEKAQQHLIPLAWDLMKSVGIGVISGAAGFVGEAVLEKLHIQNFWYHKMAHAINFVATEVSSEVFAQMAFEAVGQTLGIEQEQLLSGTFFSNMTSNGIEEAFGTGHGWVTHASLQVSTLGLQQLQRGLIFLSPTSSSPSHRFGFTAVASFLLCIIPNIAHAAHSLLDLHLQSPSLSHWWALLGLAAVPLAQIREQQRSEREIKKEFSELFEEFVETEEYDIAYVEILRAGIYPRNSPEQIRRLANNYELEPATIQELRDHFLQAFMNFLEERNKLDLLEAIQRQHFKREHKREIESDYLFPLTELKNSSLIDAVTKYIDLQQRDPRLLFDQRSADILILYVARLNTQRQIKKLAKKHGCTKEIILSLFETIKSQFNSYLKSIGQEQLIEEIKLKKVDPKINRLLKALGNTAREIINEFVEKIISKEKEHEILKRIFFAYVLRQQDCDSIQLAKELDLTPARIRKLAFYLRENFLKFVDSCDKNYFKLTKQKKMEAGFTTPSGMLASLSSGLAATGIALYLQAPQSLTRIFQNISDTFLSIKNFAAHFCNDIDQAVLQHPTPAGVIGLALSAALLYFPRKHLMRTMGLLVLGGGNGPSDKYHTGTVVAANDPTLLDAMPKTAYPLTITNPPTPTKATTPSSTALPLAAAWG